MRKRTERKRDYQREYERRRNRNRKGKRTELSRERDRSGNDRLRLACLRAYSVDPPRCACCGEKDLRFLTLDHVNNDGAAHRKSIGNGRSAGNGIYRYLKIRGFPNNPPLQVLCFNCNMGRQRNGGICPHQSADVLALGERKTPVPQPSDAVSLDQPLPLFPD